MALGVACQLVSGEHVAITSLYGELVFRKYVSVSVVEVFDRLIVHM